MPYIEPQGLRADFTAEFLYTVPDLDPFEKNMEQLIEFYDMELGEAKQRWPSLNSAQEWANMQTWLSEHGYVAPEMR